MDLFVVGKNTGGETWEFMGVFDDRERAHAACTDARFFVGPATLNVRTPEEKCPWPGAYWHNCNHSPEAPVFAAVEAPEVRVQTSQHLDIALEIFRTLEKKERDQVEQKTYEVTCAHLATLLSFVLSVEVPLAH